MEPVNYVSQLAQSTVAGLQLLAYCLHGSPVGMQTAIGSLYRDSSGKLQKIKLQMLKVLKWVFQLGVKK